MILIRDVLGKLKRRKNMLNVIDSKDGHIVDGDNTGTQQ